MCDPVLSDDEYRFYAVWVPTHGEPVRRKTFEAAKELAAEFSKRYAGNRVYVFRASGYGFTELPTTPPTGFRLLNKRPVGS